MPVSKAFTPPILSLAACLSACATAPQFEPRVPVLPATFSTGEAETAEATGAWWLRFEDPAMQELIARALSDSPGMAQAGARIRQARARERSVRAASAPSIEGAVQAGYTRISENAVPPIPGSDDGSGNETGFGLPGMDFSTFRTGFDASWETDLFGGRDHEERAAAARTSSALWSARDTEVSLAAEVGDTYLRYRANQLRMGLVNRRMDTQRALVGLTAARVRSGLATRVALREQEKRLVEIDAARESLAAERALLLHALGVLVGEAPTSLAGLLADPVPIPAAAPTIPVGLPSQLLLRRPDLRAAELHLAASVSDIGAARAALFPRIGLTGAFHLVSTSLADLLLPGSLQVNAATRLSLPIFDGGRRRATVELRNAEAEEAAATYQGRILDALRDVEDALSRLEADRNRKSLLITAEAAARDTLAVAEARHRNGIVPRMEVLAAEQAVIAAEEARIQAEAETASDVVALYKALGGGWSFEENDNG